MWNAVANDNKELVMTLIANKCDIERGGFTKGMYTTKYTTPLCKAVDDGHNEMVKVLLRGNADMLPSIRDYTPLHRAVRNGFFAIVKTLLEHKRGVQCNDQLLARFTNDQLHGGNMALHFAVSTNIMDETNSSVNRFKTVETLISHGADVHVPDMDGFSPIQTVESRIERMKESIRRMNMQLDKRGGHDRILEMRQEMDNFLKIRELLG